MMFTNGRMFVLFVRRVLSSGAAVKVAAAVQAGEEEQEDAVAPVAPNPRLFTGMQLKAATVAGWR